VKITILGGCGFIGSHLADALLAGNHEVTIFDLLNADRRNILHLEGKVRFVGGDFLNQTDVSRAVSGSELVVHLISSTLPGSSFKNPRYDVETNVVGSISLFEQCVKAKVRKVVFVSSGGTVYGIPQHLPINETHPLNPITPYGVSKVTIEKYLGVYLYQYDLDYTILRISNPYGERQNPNTGQGVIATWMYRARNGEPVEIWGDGRIVRDYIYIKDAVEAVKMAALTESKEKIVNVGSGIGYSLLQVHEILEKCVGRQVPITFKDVRRVDVPANILDISHIEALGWSPRVGLEDGIAMVWNKLRASQKH
jgi:UDP-glucose 4-epimerase